MTLDIFGRASGDNSLHKKGAKGVVVRVMLNENVAQQKKIILQVSQVKFVPLFYRCLSHYLAHCDRLFPSGCY